MFEIDLIYHSHIDNGYTDRQEKVASNQAEFIRQAVDCALHGDSDFVFTAEGFWAVEQYLKKFGGRGETKLVDAVLTGRLELTAGFCHFAELLNERNLARSLEPCRRFCERNGLPLPETAMAADINGLSYGFSEILREYGVKYLSTNINPHHGGSILGGPNRGFRWKTPSGRSLLCWNGLPYHKANLLGLIPGFAPVDYSETPGLEGSGSGKMMKITTVADAAERLVFAQAACWKRENPTLSFLPLMGSGLYTDNSPASDSHCALLRAWNEAHGDEIRIRPATLGSFFRRLETADVPTLSGDWNDWWTDGVMSTPQELRLFRNAQRTQSLLEKLDPDYQVMSEAEHEEISADLRMYAEHTWGHSASGTAGGGLLCQQLEKRKTLYAVRADAAACEAADRLYASLGEGSLRTDRPLDYLVLNPNDAPVRAACGLPMDYWETGLLEGGFCVEDAAGTRYPAQNDGTLRGLSVCFLAELGPKERRRYRIRLGESLTVSPKYPISETCFENDFFRLELGPRGAERVFDKTAGRLVTDGTHAIGQPVYQRFNGEKSAAAGPCGLPRTIPDRETFAFRSSKSEWLSRGTVFDSLRVRYEIEGATRFEALFRLYHALPRIDVNVAFDKTLEKRAEGLYAALPFGTRDASWRLDKAGTFCGTEERLPGSCGDYFNFQRGVAALRGDGAVAVNALDVPLVMFGGLHLWEYSTDVPARGCAFSWLTNNKWETNFKAECAGCHESRYVIEFCREISPESVRAVLGRNEFEPVTLRR